MAGMRDRVAEHPPFNYLAGLMMHILTMKQAQKSLKQVVEDVCRDHEPTIVVRWRGSSVVILPLSGYNGLQEAIYLLGSTANAQRLRKSIAQLKLSHHRHT
ncbi:type II toxin-antitoxin system Phd/YefM family antitoxin [Pseudomonas capsici]|uniref:type II toxin-antitoxin system Phd/YefM family antitoxin n=1 Tax=Pseudomonas capsici TaxID=2810614 RepID=UPI0021F1C7F5|nr:type II toxin-antitoxin system Phd/YefM family antitoxin [Pseudomonas capsici]MCV4272330.1 type II toxin-antitoxin system Phd/YefM family antitoxin [Pseudomonas capsici]